MIAENARQQIGKVIFTERDNEIVKYLETYKYCTIEQLEKIFFKTQQYSYNICRKRLSRLREAGYITSIKDDYLNKNIYIINEKGIKPPTYHKLKMLDVLAELIYLGYDIEGFSTDVRWMDGKIFSDAFVIFTVNNRRYYYFIEYQFSNHPHNLEKYDELNKSGECQKLIGRNVFPKILFITDKEYKDLKVKSTSVVKVDTKLNGLSSILI